MNQNSNDNTLYFGSKPQIFLQVPSSHSSRFQNNNFISHKNFNSIRNALTYRFGQKFLHPTFSKLLIPCTPAIEITEIPQEEEVDEYSTFFKMGPYLKVQTQYLRENCVYGYQSGKRSGIIQQNGIYYRLKGCGNVNEGFPLLFKVTEDNDTYEIRGCQFYHTVKRELYITQKVGLMLDQIGMKCGNKSVGYWGYSQNLDLPESFQNQVQNQCPIVGKYCAVFETLGDKRAGTHLLQGLNVLNHIMQLLNVNEPDFDKIKTMIYIPKRIETYSWEKENGTFHLSTTYCHVRDKEEFEEIGLNLKAQAQVGLIFNQEMEDTNLNTMRFIQNESNYPYHFKLNFYEDKQTKVNHLLNLLSIPQNSQEEFWNQLNQIDGNIFQWMLLLYERIGYEMGKVKRVFIDNNLNWGFYRDHHRQIFHCNSHMNNFIVLPYSEKNNFHCLAPIDFDLAFFEDEYISIEYNFEEELINQNIIGKRSDDPVYQDTYGQFDQQEWNWFQEQERQYLEMGMAGIEVIMNSIMQEINVEDVLNKNISEVAQIYDVILRDQMRIGYLEGFEMKEHSNEKLWRANITKCYKLIDLGLILTQDVIA